jgi:hypothetical protein
MNQTNSVTETKGFTKFSKTVLILLVLAEIGVLIMAVWMFPTLGAAKVMPLVYTSIGIVLTAIAVHLHKRAGEVIALICILLSAYAHLDGLRASNEPANCPAVEVSQAK